MGIMSATGPEDGEALVGRAFSAMTEGPANLFMAEAGGGAPAARVRHPIPIFSVDMEQLRDAGAEALRDARRTGWRYLVEHDAGIDVVDLPEEGDRQPELLAGGEVGGNLARSGRKAERVAESDVDYEPRILDLNLLGNSVLWLHNAGQPSDDRFVSLGAAPRELKPAALIKRLQFAARRKLTAMTGAGDEAGG